MPYHYNTFAEKNQGVLLIFNKKILYNHINCKTLRQHRAKIVRQIRQQIVRQISKNDEVILFCRSTPLSLRDTSHAGGGLVFR